VKNWVKETANGEWQSHSCIHRSGKQAYRNGRQWREHYYFRGDVEKNEEVSGEEGSLAVEGGSRLVES